MRKNRLIRKRDGKRKREVLDLDITSLLDILVIMLVFLLKSYNSTGFILNIPKGVSLPPSEAKKVSTSGLNIQVSPKKIWVDDEEVLNIKQLVENKKRNLDQRGRRIVPLYNVLEKRRQVIEQVAKTAPNATNFSGVANLVVDKSIRYSLIKKIMYTCAEAGFQKYKFVVMGEDQ